MAYGPGLGRTLWQSERRGAASDGYLRAECSHARPGLGRTLWQSERAVGNTYRMYNVRIPDNSNDDRRRGLWLLRGATGATDQTRRLMLSRKGMARHPYKNDFLSARFETVTWVILSPTSLPT